MSPVRAGEQCAEQTVSSALSDDKYHSHKQLCAQKAIRCGMCGFHMGHDVKALTVISNPILVNCSIERELSPLFEGCRPGISQIGVIL